jgi:hypothetical protein
MLHYVYFLVEIMDVPSSKIMGLIKYLLGMLHVKLNYVCDDVTYQELYNYLSGKTPTSDIIDFNHVVGNEYYLLHEIIEICELKKQRINVSGEVVIKYYHEAHIDALDKELNYVLIKNDF